ncbi:uncharacterized protein LOC130642284 [Hydractinia symbiolongicarpus]|uniref:uncharacterized protein LOC130642284 n=1 Tax=Hydractinia symbiolongicarpus TaxID=13093 RepID=UPI00255033C3|nr:uncharacterized protein LOC130642284 [Hydractinia symbiolongicarpus]
MTNFPCNICKKNVNNNHRAIQCDICNHWIHIKCNNLDNTSYNLLKQSTTPWFCIDCTAKTLPFQNLNNDQFFLNSKNINFKCNTSSQLNITPSENIEALLKEFNNLSSNMNKANDDDNPTINCQYYDINDFCSSKFKSENFFSIFHLNIASLSRHKHDLETLLNILNFDFSILAITETKIMKNLNPNYDINLEGYQLFHTPTESSAGGTLLYVRNHFNCKIRDDLNIYKSKELESIFIEIISPRKKNTIVGCVYKHPGMSIDDFNSNYFQPIINKTMNEDKSVFISGDFNINLLNISKDDQSSDFINNLFSNLCIPHITLPTRITPRSKTLIDNIFSNCLEFSDCVSGNLTSSISDHLPQFLLVPNLNIKSNSKKQNIYKRNYSKFNEEAFLLDLTKINWDNEISLSKNDPNYSFDKFNHAINQLLDKHIPLKKMSKKQYKQQSKPWITKGIYYHNCIYDLQFGFRQNHSTNNALFSITEKIRETLDFNNFAWITLDKHLKWHIHIDNLKVKLSRSIGILSKIRHYVSYNILTNIYHAIFSSHLTYGCQIWGHNKSTYLNRIISLQNKAIKIMNFKPANSPTSLLFNKSKILTFPDTIKLKDFLFAYDHYHKNLPKPLQGIFTLVTNTHTHNTRNASNNNLILPNLYAAF